MTLLDYIKRLSPERRAEFALRVGTTVGHLNNVAYGLRTASASMARQISLCTERAVSEWVLRPNDWWLIWPELVGAEGAPPVSEQLPSA
ncbi:MAG TPA: hypothetical protein PLL72_12955 [Burkholderiaceae bacterium]|nr:hypothetical protein [Burkholderiaceae bacterium]